MITTVTVTWNGTSITGPVLIYQDELVVDNSTDTTTTNGTLLCTSQDQAGVDWYSPAGVSISGTGNFRQINLKTDSESVSRLSANREDVSNDGDGANGLWTCRLNGSAPIPIPVGIYSRGGGECLG